MLSILNHLFLTLIILILNNQIILRTNCQAVQPKAPVTDENFVKNYIVNRHDFEYVLNPKHDICKPAEDGSKIFVLVYVHTAPENFKRRLSLRETWAKRSMFRDLRIVFMMGYVEDVKIRNQLALESNVYNDIVQENFKDSYRNLTYKGIMAMKWISEFCPNSKYILKVDDDIISNVFILLRHLSSLDDHKIIKEKTIMCLVWVGMVVMRDKGSKWYLSPEEFKNDRYGKYCSGSAYILTNDLPKQMYFTSQYVKFFWVDDYYMTGMLAHGVNVTYEFFNSLYIISNGLVEQRFLSKQTSSYTVFGHLPGTLNKIYTLWDFILKNQLNSFPSLCKQNAHLIYPNDFKNLKNFEWSRQLWDEFLRPPVLELDNLNENVQFDSY